MIKIFSKHRMAYDDRNQAKILFTGDYINSAEPWWLSAQSTIVTPADLEVSSLIVNGYPAGNITLTSVTSSIQDYNAALVFQRPPTDINEPSESLVMNLSPSVPTKPVDGQYITALKNSGTAYDDIAVEGLQIFGNQVIGSPAIAYITGNTTTGDVNMEINNGSFRVSSLFVSSLFADNVVSTTTGSANSYTASLYLSTPVLYTNNIVATNYIAADNISTNYISTNNGYATALSIRTANISTANISSLVAGSFGASRIDVTLLSSLTGDITFSLVSTLSLFGNTSINPNINLGLGNVIQGLIGGAASQGLGVVLGGSALATGATALLLGRTSGGANSNVFQTVNGTTQLQFSTLGSPTTSVFFDTNSASPGTTPALETSTTITVPAGAYCVRSVSDPLYINNSVSSIQSFGQWVPVIQNNPTLPSFTTSTLTTSTLVSKSAEVSTLAVSTIGGSVRMSTILTTGNITAQNTAATLTWGSPGFQTVLSQTSTVMGNAWARSMTVSGGPTNITGDTFVQQVFGLSGNFNSITGSNVINGSFLTGSNWVSTPFLTTSSMTAKGGIISSLTVSSVNGAVYPPPIPPDLFVSSLSATGTVVGAVVQASGLLTSLNTFNANIINVLGNINTSNALATANFVTVNTSTINAQTANISTINFSSLTGRAGSISSMNISSINGQAYPPSLTLPSSIFLSTVNVNGNFQMSNPSATANFVTANTSTINALTANVSTVNLSSLTGNSVISGGGSISTMNVSTLNGQPYPPPNFGIQLPSSIFLSTVNVNGNFAASNPSGSFGWPGAPGNPSTLIDQNGIQTPLINALAGSYNALSLVGSNSILNLGTLGGGGGNVATANPTSIAQFANVSTNTLKVSTMTASTIAGTVRIVGDPLGTYIDGIRTSTIQVPRLFPGNVIGYQSFNANGLYVFGIDIPSPFGLQVAGGNILANSVSTNSLVTPLVKAGQVSTPILKVNNTSGAYWEGYINSLGTSTIQVPRGLPGGGAAYQYFSENGLYVFGVEIPGGNLLAKSVSTVNLEANFIKAKGDLIGSNNNTFSWGIGNARSYIVTSTIGVTPTGVAGFPNVNVGDRLTVGNSALFTGGAQFDNTITGTGATFSGNVTTSNLLSGGLVEATQNFQAQKLGFVSSLTANIASISTNSVQNLFVSFVNGQTYPPQGGITGATPSTMLASTVFVNGGLTNTGLAPIISPIGNFSTLSSVRVQGLLTASNVVFNAGMTNTGALPIITSNLSAVNINNVLFINGQIYPPPTGSTSIPSTLFASTVFVNGGQTITNAPLTFFDTALNRTNGNIIANSGTLQIAIPEVGSPGGSGFTITAGSTLASTLVFIFPTGRSRFTSSMTVRDPVPTGTPSQAYITTYSIGSESPAGSIITANVSTTAINTSSITFAGSGSRIVGDATGVGPGINFFTNDFQIFSASGTTQYLNMEQGAGAYTGSTFFDFGALNNPATAYITAGNYWTYFPQVGAIPAGGLVTSTISTTNLVANNAFFGNTSTNTLWAGNLSTPTISVSSINNFSPLPPSVSGNIQMTLDTTNGAGGFGSFQIQPLSSLYIKAAIDIPSAGGFGDTLRTYGSTLSIGSAQVVSPIVLSADSIVSTANIQWGFAKDGSPPITTALSYFINNTSTSKTNVKTTLGSIGVPNPELYTVLDTGLLPGYLTIKNTTNSIIYVEGVPQHLSATTAPYGI